MLFFLVVASVSFQDIIYCNESTVLPPNTVCCGKVVCEGFCYPYGNYCANKVEKFVCMDIYKGYLSVLAIFLLPTISFQLVSICTKFKIPGISMLTDILINITLSAVIYGCICSKHFIKTTFWFLIYGGPFWILFAIFRLTNSSYNCDCGRGQDLSEEDYKRVQREISRATYGECCGCCYGDDDSNCQCCFGSMECLETLKEINGPVIKKDELITIIEENHIIPPSPQVAVIDFNKGPKGETYIVKKRYHPINYGSWEEASPIPKYSSSNAITYNCHSQYIYDDDMVPEIERSKQEAQSEFPREAMLQAMAEISQTSGFIHRATGVQKMTGTIKCCTSPFVAKFLYRFLVLIGYSGIADFIWLSSVEKFEETSIKKVAFNEVKYCTKSGERDRGLISELNSRPFNGI